MKCVSCDVVLSNREISRKSLNTNDYLDMCDSCLSELNECLDTPIKTKENPFIKDTAGYDDE